MVDSIYDSPSMPTCKGAWLGEAPPRMPPDIGVENWGAVMPTPQFVPSLNWRKLHSAFPAEIAAGKTPEGP